MLIVVGGGISWWNATKKITSPPPELLDLVVPADWKIYRDELEGIELRYPKEWFLGVIPSKGEALFEVRNFSQYAEGGVIPSNGTVFSFKKGCESGLNTDGYVTQDFGASYKELEKSFCKEGFQVFLNVGMESSIQDKNILEMIPNSLIKITDTSTASTIINISNWKTYTNEQYGFEIRYPKSFVKAKDLYNDKSYPDDRIIFSDENSLTGSGAIQMLFSDKPLDTYCDNTGCKQRNIQVGNVKIIIKYLEDATSVAEIPLSDGKYLQFMMGSVSPDADDFFNKFLSTFKFIELEQIDVNIGNLKPNSFEWCIANGGEDRTPNYNAPKVCIFENKVYEENCISNNKYFVIEKNLTDSVGANHLIKFKTDANQNFVCEYVVEKGDFEIKNEWAEYTLALENNFLILDSGTGPDPRGLIIYNLSTRKKVYTDEYFEPVLIQNNTINYWNPTNQKATNENCPKLNEYLSGGLGAGIDSHVLLDLLTLSKKELGEYRCSPRQ